MAWKSPFTEITLSMKVKTEPSVSGLNFKPDTAKRLAYPEARMDEMKLFAADWAYVNPRRAAWLEKTNQIFLGG